MYGQPLSWVKNCQVIHCISCPGFNSGLSASCHNDPTKLGEKNSLYNYYFQVTTKTEAKRQGLLAWLEPFHWHLTVSNFITATRYCEGINVFPSFTVAERFAFKSLLAAYLWKSVSASCQELMSWKRFTFNNCWRNDSGIVRFQPDFTSD